MLDFFEWLLGTIADGILSILPTSPFSEWIDSFASISSEWLGWLNWFIPVGTIIKVGIGWLGCVAAFYAYSAILRWIKLIGD